MNVNVRWEAPQWIWTESDRYKWTALSNTTLGMFMATLDCSIVLISLPAIFRGIHLDPLPPATSATCCGC